MNLLLYLLCYGFEKLSWLYVFCVTIFDKPLIPLLIRICYNFCKKKLMAILVCLLLLGYSCDRNPHGCINTSCQLTYVTLIKLATSPIIAIAPSAL